MGQYLYNYILIMFKQIVLSCLVASAVSLPQFGSFGPGIRSGPLTPVYGDLFQTPRGLVPLSLEGFSEDVDQDGFVDPVVQTDLPAPAPVALPVNFGTPIPATFPVSAFPGVPVAAQNVAIENTGFAPNLGQGFAAQQFATTGFPNQQIALANPNLNNPGFATNLVAQQNAPIGFAAQQLRPRGFASQQVAPASFAAQQGVHASFAAQQGVPGSFTAQQGVSASFAALEVAPAAFAVEQGVNSQGFQTSFADPVTAALAAQQPVNNFAGQFAGAAGGPCVNNFGASVPCAL